MLEAEKQFRRIKGNQQMPALRRHAETVTGICDTAFNDVAA